MQKDTKMPALAAPMVFFGTSAFSVHVLEELSKQGIIPDAIVTAPDRPKGRKLRLQPPPTKLWAQEHDIPVMQFSKLDDEAAAELARLRPQLFIVASYGLIVSQKVLDIPKYGALNIHPSLLPLYRGASPLQSMILSDDRDVGVTIMQMDAKMDHGPIVAQARLSSLPSGRPGFGASIEWPPRFEVLEKVTAEAGADLLIDSLDGYIKAMESGDVSAQFQTQEDPKATFTKKIAKEDGLIDIHKALNDGKEGYKAFLKIQAFHGWPNAYFFIEKGKDRSTPAGTTEVTDPRKIRVIIKDARWDADERKLVITRIIPEGGKEMDHDDFIRGSHLQI